MSGLLELSSPDGRGWIVHAGSAPAHRTAVGITARHRTRRSSAAGRRTREAALLRDDEVLPEDLRTRHLVEEPLDPVDDRRRDAVRLVDHELAVVVVREEAHLQDRRRGMRRGGVLITAPIESRVRE